MEFSYDNSRSMKSLKHTNDTTKIGLFDDHHESKYRKNFVLDLDVINNVNEFWEANSESDTETDSEDNDGNKERKKFKLISFRKLKSKMSREYDTTIVQKYSTALDLFVRYIQCYHILYSEASHYCRYKLNLFMLPCLFLSTSCSVITSIHFEGVNTKIFLSILNGIITFLLAIINYLKLDANAEAHKISAYQYAKLKSQIEFHSGELLMYENDPLLSNHEKTDKNTKKEKKDKENDFILKVQNIIVSIKETLKNVEDNNNFSLPPHIIRKYSTIYNMNIFLHIKSIDTYKNVLLNDLRNVKNELRFYTKMGKSKDETLKEKYISLYHKKNILLQEFLELNKGYTLIDHMLQQELTNIDLYTKYWMLFYLQNVIDHFTSCFCWYKAYKKWNIIPKGYKTCYEIGYKDENNQYLLDKVLKY